MDYEKFSLNAFGREANGDCIDAIMNSSVGVEGWATADVGNLEAEFAPAAGVGEFEVSHLRGDVPPGRPRSNI